MSEPAVVVHVFGRMQRGGAELRTVELMRHIDRARWQFRFAVLSGLPGDLDSEIRELGGQVLPMRLGLGFPLRFVRVLRRLSAEVVHSHVHQSSGLILRLASLAGVPTRVANFWSTSDGKSNKLRRRLQRNQMKRWINSYATHILAVSEGTMAAAWTPSWASGPRCRIVYSGLDLAAFKAERLRDEVRAEFGLAKDASLYCHVGTFRAAKNHMRLVEIMACLRQRSPDARLLIVGREDVRIAPEVKQRAAQLGIREFIRFSGDRTDVPRILLASDAMIYPSLWEGLPGAVLEACAAGLPVIGSDLPGIHEIARYFPRVRTLSLEQSNDEWAEAIVRSAGPERGDDGSWDSELAFKKTPFSMTHTVRALTEVYSGPA